MVFIIAHVCHLADVLLHRCLRDRIRPACQCCTARRGHTHQYDPQHDHTHARDELHAASFRSCAVPLLPLTGPWKTRYPYLYLHLPVPFHTTVTSTRRIMHG